MQAKGSPCKLGQYEGGNTVRRIFEYFCGCGILTGRLNEVNSKTGLRHSVPNVSARRKGAQIIANRRPVRSFTACCEITKLYLRATAAHPCFFPSCRRPRGIDISNIQRDGLRNTFFIQPKRQPNCMLACVRDFLFLFPPTFLDPFRVLVTYAK